jgi:hypothetical protein
MRRVDIIADDGQWIGWFNYDSAEKIAEYEDGGPYKYGKILLATKGKKLVVNEWNNTGRNACRLAEDEREIAEILTRSSYDEDYSAHEDLAEILSKYEM